MQKLNILISAFFLLTLFSCINEDSYPGYVNSLEIDRAWQFLQKFSIYTNRIPTRDSAQNFASPESLALSINDTIRYPDPYDYNLAYFTYYSKNWQNMVPPVDSTKISSLRATSNTIFCQKLSDSILYVLVPTFMTDIATEMKNYTGIDNSISSIILDLRWNGGGYVSVCTSMVNIILPENTEYLKTIFRNDNLSNTTTSAKLDTVVWKTPTYLTSKWKNKKVAILMNDYTASAAEIVIAGIRDNLANCYTVGDTTFGKAIGQGHYYFNATSGAGMSITSLRFYRKDNSDYHNIGIVPDTTILGTDELSLTKQLLVAARYLDNDFDSIENSNFIKEINDKFYSAHYRSFKSSRNFPQSWTAPSCIVGEYYNAELLLND